MAKIVFLGDSITAYMPYIFKGTIGNDGDEVIYHGIENIGVGSFMNYVWPRLEEKNVDTYILLIGINNLFRPDCDYDNRESIEEVILKIKEFIKLISESSDARLIVQSLYPNDTKSIIHQIELVNNNIQEYCSSIEAEYLDIYPILVDEEGLMKKEYTKDGIHPNEQGYQVIAEEINKILHKQHTKKLINPNDYIGTIKR